MLENMLEKLVRPLPLQLAGHDAWVTVPFAGAWRTNGSAPTHSRPRPSGKTVAVVSDAAQTVVWPGLAEFA